MWIKNEIKLSGRGEYFCLSSLQERLAHLQPVFMCRAWTVIVESTALPYGTSSQSLQSRLLPRYAQSSSYSRTDA